MEEENKYLKRQEIIDYPGKKLPVAFLIDMSDSMNKCKGGTPTGETQFSDGVAWFIVRNGSETVMDRLKRRVQDFHEAMARDRRTSVTCQTAFVGFGDRARVLDDFSLVKNKAVSTDRWEAGDNDTFIADGIEMALRMLDGQKELIQKEGGDYYQPWLLIFTDGKAHDSPERLQRIKRELLERQNSGKLTVYAVALGDDPELYSNIRGYSKWRPIPYDAEGEKLSEFFEFLKRSVSSISAGKVTKSIPSFGDPDDMYSLQ